MKNKTIVFDFDGVIYSYLSGFDNGELTDPLIAEESKHILLQLKEAGYRIVICTARLSQMWDKDHRADQMLKIMAYLNKQGIQMHTHYDRITADKEPAIAYIDDRGIRFTNWEDIKKYFL